MVRAILTWRILEEDLVGTWHIPIRGGTRDAGPPYSLASSTPPRIGILLLNAGPAPRAGNSDLYVQIGDALATLGFPVFRFDFAGLGDSSGAASSNVEDYWRGVLAGSNDEATRALILRIRQEFTLSHLVVGGLCAAIVPTLRAAERDPQSTAGLILLEPEFRDEAQDRSSSWHGHLVRECIDYLNRPTGMSAAITPFRALLRNPLRGSVGSLPRGTNVELVRQWQSCLERGMRSLVVVAEGQSSDGYVGRILESFPEDHSRLVLRERVPETNHTLSTARARTAIVNAVRHWTIQSFGKTEPSSACVASEGT